MHICLIGKYPPIQGGVSTRTYHMAHELAKRGHQVHVVTNAQEVELPWRLMMRPEDWERCEADYGEGSVRVSWTEPMDRRQRYIPGNNPWVTKLASLALTAHQEAPFDLIHSYYLEPYGIAGHMVAQALDLPHVVKTAGSDAGKLWHHEQFEPLYDHVLSNADLFVAGGSVTQRAIEHGVDPLRVTANRGFQLSTDLFCPERDRLDLSETREWASEEEGFKDLCWGSFRGDRPYIGVYGKLGERKGSFALLDALGRARAGGADIGLVALAHGHPDIEAKFRRTAAQLELEDHVLQLPFLPHWRVPSFIRSCLAVCCLEQDFPIAIHNPIVTEEVMSCGTCLIAATELLNKHIHARHLVAGVNCVAIRDVNDTAELAQALIAVANGPDQASAVGGWGRRYVKRHDPGMAFAGRTETLFKKTIEKRPSPPLSGDEGNQVAARGSLTWMALQLLEPAAREACLATVTAEPETPEWVAAILTWSRGAAAQAAALPVTVMKAIEVDCAIRSVTAAPGDQSGLFRAGDGLLGGTAPLDLKLSPMPGAQLLQFDVALAPFIAARQPGDLPKNPAPGDDYLLVVPVGRDNNAVIPLDPTMASFWRRCDGLTSAREILAGLEGAEDLTPAMLAERLRILLVEGALMRRPA